MRRISRAAVLFVFVGAAVVTVAIKAAEPLLLVRTSFEPADVIVVPGGDGPRRAWRAAEIYRAGAAPLVLVTGFGDCGDIRDLMVRDGVPADVIQVECAALSTWENATFSAPLLATMGARRAILVTSWFHSRRALATFRRVMPRLRLISTPAEPTQSFWDVLRSDEGPAVMKEYAKIGWYFVRYGVNSMQPDDICREASADKAQINIV